MLKSSYRSNRSLTIHPYRWNPDQYTVTVAVHKDVKRGVLLCSRGISMTYPDASLTLNVMVAQRENVVLIYCEPVLLHQHVAQNPTPPCLHKHTSPHGLSFHTGGLHFSKTIQVKPLLYFVRMQDMWWAPVFNSVSRGGLICVCVHMCWNQNLRERLSQSVNLLWLDLCVAPFCEPSVKRCRAARQDCWVRWVVC